MKSNCFTLLLVVLYGLLLVSFAKRNNPAYTHVQGEPLKEIRTSSLGRTPIGTWPSPRQNNGVRVNGGGIHTNGGWGGSGGWHHNGVGTNGKGNGN